MKRPLPINLKPYRRTGMVGIAQLHILCHLHMHGRTTSTQLAAVCGVSSSAITGSIDSLEQHRLVTRTPVAGDRRTRVIDLTPEGQDLIRETFPDHFAPAVTGCH